MTGGSQLVALVEDVVGQAAALDLTSAGPATLAHIGEVFADTVGVMAAGSRSPQIRALAADAAFGLGEQGPARSLAPGTPRGAAHTVAWVNGTAGTFLELDEGFRPTGHPAIHVIPAALAVAETVHAAGSRLALAIAAGYEVAARLFESFRLPTTMHPHGHFGGIGAATAVAILEGEDPVALARIAATQSMLTGWEACYEGATARNTWSGHANRTGVIAGSLHRAGFTGSLGSHLSIVEEHLLDAHTLGEAVRPDTLRILRNYLKFHSACALTHTSLDAVLEARRQLTPGELDDIRRVEVQTVTSNLRIARQAAPNELSTRFSLPYAVAVGLSLGTTDPASFVWREDVATLAGRVEVRSSPSMDTRWPDAAPASVRIVTSRRDIEVTVDNPLGHSARPASRDRIREKFVGLGGTLESFEALSDLASVDDCARLPLALDGPSLHM